MVQINNPLNNGFFRVDFGSFVAGLGNRDDGSGNKFALFVRNNFENGRNAADSFIVGCSVGGKAAAAVRDKAVFVKFDGACYARHLSEYDIRAGIKGSFAGEGEILR